MWWISLIISVHAQEPTTTTNTTQSPSSPTKTGKGVVLEKDTAKTYGYHRTTWVKELDWFENRFLSFYAFKKDSLSETADSLDQRTSQTSEKHLPPRTSSDNEFTMEELIAYQRSKGYAIDTNLTSFQRYSVVEQAAYRRQDLSNSGTPSQAIFDRTPTDIGIRWSLSTLNPYILQVHEVPYYDTQSPMTEWRYSQGGDGRIRMDVRFTRNVHSRWNLGALYGRASGRVLRGYRSVRKNDFQTIHENMLFHTSYQSKTRQYRLMAHFFAFRNNTKETGGIHADSLVNSGNVEGVNTFEDLFRLGTGALNNRLTDARSYQRESRYYLYHQLGLLDSTLQYRTLQVFQSLQYRSHKFVYKDARYSTNFYNFYDHVSTYSRPLSGVASLQNQVFFELLEHRLGVKSSLGRFFVAGYYKTRFYTWQFNSLPSL
ncbi:MAG: putative porin, partial [Flammeovirgaceae bacterium]|nr:putative porin [Flammeovirgaceae bacterium]MDW8288726.1 putative porin [Flammeovirgaceae bacterium]